MTLKQLILEMAKSKKKFQASDIQKKSKFTKQQIDKILKDLTDNGYLVKIKEGMSVSYRLQMKLLSSSYKLSKKIIKNIS